VKPRDLSRDVVLLARRSMELFSLNLILADHPRYQHLFLRYRPLVCLWCGSRTMMMTLLSLLLRLVLVLYDDGKDIQ
jgi:hypothetical protein